MSDPLRGGRVRLRPLVLDDADALAQIGTDPLVRRFLPRLPQRYSDAVTWITDGSVTAIANGGREFAVADLRTGALVGSVGCAPPINAVTTIWYWTTPAARGAGVGTESVRLLASHLFASGVHRVCLANQHTNVGSQRVAIAAGFSREGVARGAGLDRDGGRYDLIQWARLASDPDRPSRRLLPDLPGYAGPDNPGQLTDGVVVLRPQVAEDCEDTYALRGLPDVVATSVPPTAPSRASVARACAHSASAWLSGERANLTIRDVASGAYAGEIGLYYLEPATGQAMIGYCLVPRWRGRGFAARAARLVSTWAFETTDIVRVIAGTSPQNLASQRTLERAGFVREGYQTSRLPGPNGTRTDDIQFALLAPRLAAGPGE
jgi:RimJ/RimL family protein N-acetyltransferase